MYLRLFLHNFIWGYSQTDGIYKLIIYTPAHSRRVGPLAVVGRLFDIIHGNRTPPCLAASLRAQRPTCTQPRTCKFSEKPSGGAQGRPIAHLLLSFTHTPNRVEQNKRVQIFLSDDITSIYLRVFSTYALPLVGVNPKS